MQDTTAAGALAQPWYRLLDRRQWNTLFASNLGWMFDGYETYALLLTIGVALRQLLEPSQYPQIPQYAGFVIGLTLLGWGIGGMIGGILADYIGRKRTMMYAILAYSLMTGLSAFAWNWESFAVLRSSSASPSAPNGPPAPRSSPSCGPIARAAKAPA